MVTSVEGTEIGKQQCRVPHKHLVQCPSVGHDNFQLPVFQPQIPKNISPVPIVPPDVRREHPEFSAAFPTQMKDVRRINELWVAMGKCYRELPLAQYDVCRTFRCPLSRSSEFCDSVCQWSVARLKTLNHSK